MASEYETVNSAIAKARKEIDYSEGVLLHLTGNRANEIFDCIEAAHRREVSELKHWIKSAARWITCHDIYHTSGNDLIKQAKEILNDNGEFLFKKGEM